MVKTEVRREVSNTLFVSHRLYRWWYVSYQIQPPNLYTRVHVSIGGMYRVVGLCPLRLVSQPCRGVLNGSPKEVSNTLVISRWLYRWWHVSYQIRPPDLYTWVHVSIDGKYRRVGLCPLSWWTGRGKTEDVEHVSGMLLCPQISAQVMYLGSRVGHEVTRRCIWSVICLFEIT